MYTSYLFISFQSIFNDFCCFRDLQIIARYVNAIFAMYTFHFKVFLMIFAVPVCLLLLIVVVFYFICLYIVYPV